MTRYDWPVAPGARRGRAAERRAYTVSSTAGSQASSDDGTRPEQPRPPGSAPLGGPVVHPVLRAAPPGTPGRQWLPLGPVGTLRGSGDSDPRVAGRLRDLAVSDDGQRMYAASALGGLWYSADAGAAWEPVGAWAVTPTVDLAASSTTLACGAAHVRFDPGGDVAQDEVWLATGEPDPSVQPFDTGVVGQYGGVGVLHATGPVETQRTTPAVDPWTREAQPSGAYPGLRGAGIFTLVQDPATPGRLAAATTRGLHLRDPAAIGEPWSVVTVAAWEAVAAGSSARAVVTDVVWVATPAGERLWVAVAGANVDQRLKGLWRSDNGTAGPFVRVDLPGASNTAGRTGLLRVALAAAPSDPTVLYALANAPRMWRVDGDTVVRRVRDLPGDLFSGVPGQSEYDMAIAVDPGNPARVLLGGASVESTIDTSMVAAALYRLTLRLPAPAPGGQWRTDYTGGNQWDARWIGAEIHPDVHRLRWIRPPASPHGHVLVCCDGGLWRSTADGDPLSFTSRATGLAVTEAGFVAAHPASPGVVLAGVQDNGVQLRIGESVWRRALGNGDGGGVAFDPGRGDRFIGQATRSAWTDQTDTTTDPTWRTTANAPQRAEQSASRFYSNAAVIRRAADGVTQLAVGTTRVWYSERWLHSWLDTGANVFRIHAVTLPSRADPRAGDAADTTTDVLAPGPAPAGTVDLRATGIRVLRWAGEDRLYALMRGAVHRLDRSTSTGRWTLTQIHRRTASGPPIPVAVGPNLPREGSLNDLAPHDPAAGPHGSFYLATANPVDPVWWFDGTGTWHPCRLGTPPSGTPVTATCYSVVVDPADPAVVYAGTSIGVWRGELTTPGGTPTWGWHPLTAGLPEAAVQDLVISTYPRPDGTGDVRLMRAALQARGVWEIDLDTDVTALAYLRAHPYDTRRLLPTPMGDPLRGASAADAEWHLDWADARARDFRTGTGQPAPHPDGTPVGEFLWHASPDVRIRPAPGAPPLPAPATLPWTARPVDRFALWALQTSLHALEPRIVPDGRWTAMFRRRLRALRTARGLSDGARVDAALWNHADVQAGFWTDPWAEGGPTEADLVERLVGMPTPRAAGGPPTAAAVSPASVAIPAGPCRVDVCVHHRGPLPAAGSGIAVVLLTAALPGPAPWALPSGVLTAVAGPLEAAMAGAPAGGGPLPAPGVPAGYGVADPALPIRRPAGTLDVTRPAVVSFDLDLTGRAPGDRLLLLALVHAGPSTPLLVETDVPELVRRSPQAAARSVEIAP